MCLALLRAGLGFVCRILVRWTSFLLRAGLGLVCWILAWWSNPKDEQGSVFSFVLLSQSVWRVRHLSSWVVGDQHRRI